jgi:hypothetical protein
MNDINPRSNLTTFWVLWVLTSIVGWAASHSALQILSLNSARDIVPWAAADILDGALIGAIITFGQWLILLNIFPGFSRRFLATALLYPVGLLIGLVVFSFWGLAQLARVGGTFLIISPSNTLLVAGVIISVGQWFLLRSFVTPNLQSAALWVLGTVAGLGLGGFYGGGHFALLDPTTLFPDIRDIVGGAFTGFVSGGVTGTVLIILLKQNRESRLMSKSEAIW